MYKEPIFLAPVFKERIWGGDKLKEEFDYDIPNDKTGEAWVVSALPNGSNEIEKGRFAGKTLLELWKDHGELFNKTSQSMEEYPLLVKVLDANDDLSIQVHPNDAYAKNMEQVPYGKTESWYVIKAEPGAELVLGHHAQDRQELEKMMDEGKWDELLRRVKVKAGDFFYVPSGTLHAIGKGIMILEIQQSSDVTYRVYDYDRLDSEGRPRDLHLEQAKAVINVPDLLTNTDQKANESTAEGGLTIQQLVEAEYFSVDDWQFDGEVQCQLDRDFLQVSVISGDANLKIDGKSFAINKGHHFIIPHGVETYHLSGHAELIVSHV